MLTLKESMELAGKNLLAILSPAQGYQPYWGVTFDRDKRAECRVYWASHNTGRWWDALLRLENATGFAIPADLEEAMTKNLKSCLANPLLVCGLLESRIGLASGLDPAGWFDDHSQREALLALACLVRYRQQAWAADLGHRMVKALNSYIQGDGSWDFARMGNLARQGGITVDQNNLDWYAANFKGFRLVENHGRLIEALLEFHTASGSDEALMLASRLAHFHYDVSTLPDGSVPAAEHTHTHSLFGTYRGLLKFGQLTCQHDYVDRMVKTYFTSVRKFVRQSGFISHDLGKENDGETASPGDAAQLALWLSRSGYAELLDDAERIVRSRILPSQITKPLGLLPLTDDGKDEHSRLDDRVLGSFGGVHRHAHGGNLPFTDVTAADLHTLCDIYTHVVDTSPLGLQINFHFDYEDARIRIQSMRAATARLKISLKSPHTLLIRIPGWSPLESVHLVVNAQPAPVFWVGHFLYVPKQAEPLDINVEYGLPVTTLDEATDGVTYHFTWRGDEIIAMTPNTDWLPFYPGGNG